MKLPAAPRLYLITGAGRHPANDQSAGTEYPYVGYEY
jgi:hypothetical protein